MNDWTLWVVVTSGAIGFCGVVAGWLTINYGENRSVSKIIDSVVVMPQSTELRMSKQHNNIFGHSRPLTVLRCLTRRGVTVRVIDRRESYRERRAVAGYEKTVPLTDKIKANNVMIEHRLRKSLAPLGPLGASAQQAAKAMREFAAVMRPR